MEQKWITDNVAEKDNATLIPIQDVVLNDADYDIWGEVKPMLIYFNRRRYDKAIIEVLQSRIKCNKIKNKAIKKRLKLIEKLKLLYIASENHEYERRMKEDD